MLLGARCRFANTTKSALFAAQFPFRNFANQDNFLNGSNANYIDYMYSQWE